MASRSVRCRAGRSRAPAGQQRQAPLQPGQQRRAAGGRSTRAAASSMRQRQPVQPAADRGHRRRVRRRSGRSRVDRPRPLDEQARPPAAAPAPSASARVGRRAGPAAAPGAVLAPRAAARTRLVASTCQARAGGQQVGDERARPRARARSCRAPGAARRSPQERGQRARPSGRSPASRTPSAWAIAGGDEGRVGERGEGDEARRRRRRRRPTSAATCEGEAGLADPAGAGQGQQRHVVAQQQLADGGDLALPADEGCAGQREVEWGRRRGGGHRRSQDSDT